MPALPVWRRGRQGSCAKNVRWDRPRIHLAEHGVWIHRELHELRWFSHFHLSPLEANPEREHIMCGRAAGPPTSVL